MDTLRSEGVIVPISPVKETPCHLLYADDIMFFLKAIKKSLRRLQCLLNLYQDSSGQSINLQKSQLFVSKGARRRANMIADLLSIPLATLPSTYLGVPLFYGSPRHRFFTKILDCFRSRLARWKLRCLSFASHLTLVKHVLSSIRLHISMVIPIPSKTCLSLERLMRNFLWSASSDNSRNHLVN